MLFIKETFVNETKGYQFGGGEWVEAFTDNRGRLFREMQKEYGRCKSSVYIDVADGPPVKIGWYFEKEMEYEDSRVRYDFYGREVKPEKYLRGVWVEVREGVKIECSNCGCEWEGLPRSACPECWAVPVGRDLVGVEAV
jgi:hypothetical protein